MADEKKRSQISLPLYHHQKGMLWAWAKSRPLASLISDVFQARVEANEDEINEMLDFRAKQMGISRDELIAQILSNHDDD